MTDRQTDRQTLFMPTYTQHHVSNRPQYR